MDTILLAVAAGGIGLVAAALLAMRVLKQPQGNDEVRDIGALIQEGSSAFLRKEYSILALFVLVSCHAVFHVIVLPSTARTTPEEIGAVFVLTFSPTLKDILYSPHKKININIVQLHG